mmetsp:Transcript_66255/g.209469  ORF Transcript_66255/g.209469 Transcript_66255/m.209469 type:complete len:238 (-) Transcript_66255:594-1307(-)
MVREGGCLLSATTRWARFSPTLEGVPRVLRPDHLSPEAVAGETAASYIQDMSGAGLTPLVRLVGAVMETPRAGNEEQDPMPPRRVPFPAAIRTYKHMTKGVLRGKNILLLVAQDPRGDPAEKMDNLEWFLKNEAARDPHHSSLGLTERETIWLDVSPEPTGPASRNFCELPNMEAPIEAIFASIVAILRQALGDGSIASTLAMGDAARHALNKAGERVPGRPLTDSLSPLPPRAPPR